MKKTLLIYSLLVLSTALFAQTKFIRVECGVSGQDITFTLYKMQTDSSFAALKAGTSSNGFYTFDSLSTGIYRLHQNIGYNKYLPTWHPRKALWEESVNINMNTADSFIANEGLLPNPVFTGPCTIAGTLTEGLLKGAGDPLKNVRVILLSNGVLIKMLNTNDSGKFSATSLPTGTYIIRTDLVNTKDPSPKTVTVDSNNTTASVALTVSKNGSVNTGIKTVKHNKTKVYPNPASDKINLDVDGAYSAQVIDITGKTVKQLKSYNMQSLDISDLKKGIYFLRIQTDAGNETRKIIVE